MDASLFPNEQGDDTGASDSAASANGSGTASRALAEIQKIQDRVVTECEALHRLQFHDPQSIPELEQRFREVTGRLTQLMVQLFCIPEVVAKRGPLCRKFAQFVLGLGETHATRGTKNSDGPSPTGDPFFKPWKPKVVELGRSLGLVQSSIALTSHSSSRGSVTRQILTMDGP